ncbi:MAG: cyclase family protein [bacterium]
MKRKRFVDLSIAIEPGLPSDPPMMVPKVTYSSHEEGAEGMRAFFPGLERKDLPGGLGWAVEHVELSTHSGTHLDAPWHYHPTMDGGRRAWTIDEIPLEWCMGDGIVLDLRHLPDGYKVMPADLEEALGKTGCRLKPLDIVLAMTGADRFWGTPEYLLRGCGMGREATLWFLDRGVRVVGTDAWSWDRPLPLIAEEFRRTGRASIIWEGHFAGIEKGYCHMEKLRGLDGLPPSGFTIFCFPVKVRGASAGWVRAVALVEEEA